MQIKQLFAGAAALAALTFAAGIPASAQTVIYQHTDHRDYDHSYNRYNVPNTQVIITHPDHSSYYYRHRRDHWEWVPGHMGWVDGRRAWIPAHRVYEP